MKLKSLIFCLSILVLSASTRTLASGTGGLLSQSEADVLFILLVFVAPTLFLGLGFTATHFYLRKRGGESLRKARLIFAGIFTLILLNAIGAYYWY